MASTILSFSSEPPDQLSKIRYHKDTNGSPLKGMGGSVGFEIKLEDVGGRGRMTATIYAFCVTNQAEGMRFHPLILSMKGDRGRCGADSVDTQHGVVSVTKCVSSNSTVTHCFDGVRLSQHAKGMTPELIAAREAYITKQLPGTPSIGILPRTEETFDDFHYKSFRIAVFARIDLHGDSDDSGPIIVNPISSRPIYNMAAVSTLCIKSFVPKIFAARGKQGERMIILCKDIQEYTGNLQVEFYDDNGWSALGQFTAKDIHANMKKKVAITVVVPAYKFDGFAGEIDVKMRLRAGEQTSNPETIKYYGSPKMRSISRKAQSNRDSVKGVPQPNHNWDANLVVTDDPTTSSGSDIVTQQSAAGSFQSHGADLLSAQVCYADTRPLPSNPATVTRPQLSNTATETHTQPFNTATETHPQSTNTATETCLQSSSTATGTRPQPSNTATETHPQLFDTATETRPQLLNTATEICPQPSNTATETRPQSFNTATNDTSELFNTATDSTKMDNWQVNIVTLSRCVEWGDPGGGKTCYLEEYHHWMREPGMES